MRKDIPLRENEIRGWVSQKMTKTFMCHELKCRPDTLNRFLTKIEINYCGNQGLLGKKTSAIKLSASEYIKSSTVKSNTLKWKLIEEGIKKHECEECRLAEWMGKSIPIELDHIDGNRFNNDFSNLKILCPNCHALTPTYCRPKIRPCG